MTNESNHSAAGERLLQGLNPAQREAVAHKDGPMLVLAGPGSGKTRVVTHRVAWLMEQGVRDHQILALTFTNKAADEMKTRLLTLAPGSRVWIGTFHRFCAYLLRYYGSHVGLEPNYAIYDADESKKLLESVVPKNSLPTGVDIVKISSAISCAKNDLVSCDDYCARFNSLLGRVVEEAYPAYQRALRRANAVDFDDLLFLVATLLQKNPEIRRTLDSRFRYILVDEYQDTNLVQYAIARALSIDYPNLAATGDPDQSIYGWRGANINNILNFEHDFENVKVVRLEQNYRSVKSVLRIADALIKHNVYRKDKTQFTDNEEGVPPRLLLNADQDEEADAIAAEIAAEIAAGKRRPRDYAIFYRMNALSRNLEYALRRYGVPFQLVRGLEFFNRKEIKDLCAYLQLIYNSNDVVSFRRVVNLPARGVGAVSINKLERYAEARDISLYEACRAASKIPSLSSRVQKTLGKFVALIEKLRDAFAEGADLEVVLGMLLKEIRYVEFLRDSSKTEEDEQRLANIQELLSEAREFDADFNRAASDESPVPDLVDDKRDRLGSFLEQIALVNDVDSWDAGDDRVSLMTLHAAKGLEFPVVYLVALEEGVLPHERSTHNKKQLEEERRLLFVGLTRAKEEIRMSRTRFREFRGSYSPTISSRFIFDFPKNNYEQFGSLDEWLAARRAEAARDPEANVVVPRIIERQGGVSQRQAIWNAESLRDRFEDAQDAFSAQSLQYALGERKRRRPDFADVDEYADPEPNDDYSQLPDDEREATTRTENDVEQEEAVRLDDDREIVVDPEYAESVYSESDFDDEWVERRSLSRRAKDSRRAPSPSALTSGAALTGSENSHKTRNGSNIDKDSFVRHAKYGVGIVKKISGPSFGRIASVSFLSGVGDVDLPLDDPDLSLIVKGRKNK